MSTQELISGWVVIGINVSGSDTRKKMEVSLMVLLNLNYHLAHQGS